MAFEVGDFFEGRPFGSDEDSAGWGADVFDPFDFSGAKQKNRDAKFQAKQEAALAALKQLQLGMLQQYQAPTLTPAQEARIKALETDAATPLEQDAHFQTAMRQATSGGAQALSGIQNVQAARGGSGGFTNQGSVADVYDRLGVQLADLGQKQTNYKDNARNQAADMRQNFQESQRAYNNAMIDAKTAIEVGDSQAMQAAMSRAYQAQSAADAARRNQVMEVGKMVGGVFTGGATMAIPTPKQNTGGGNQGQGPTQDSYNQQAAPYASTNYFSDSLSGGGGFKPYYQSRKSGGY